MPIGGASSSRRFEPLPAGSHGLDPSDVRGDQARRLREAMIELIADKGYAAVRIADLARLAHVSPPTLYSLYASKEELLLGAYEQAAWMVGEAILAADTDLGEEEDRLRAGLDAFATLAAREPGAVSLLVLGVFGAGPAVLRRRRLMLETLEEFIRARRSPRRDRAPGDHTLRALLGGIREITAAHLRDGRGEALPALAGPLSAWAGCYPAQLPDGLAAVRAPWDGRERRRAPRGARRAATKLPSGPRGLAPEEVARSQQERIVDATAAIVAESGLAALTIPAIVKRANVSNQTFYALYASKHDAFLGAQKVGMHQALQVTAAAYGAYADDWPRAVTAGIGALLDYLASEPAHARLTVVDTFAASPQAIAVRRSAIEAFCTYLAPGFERAGAPAELPGELVAEGVVGGIWQVLHDYIERGEAASLPTVAPQLSYFALAPFLGAGEAAAAARAARQR